MAALLREARINLYKRHSALGESPLSALCDDRFDDVKAVIHESLDR